MTESLKICLSLTFGWLLSASASFAAEAPVAATTSLDITNAVVTIGLDGSTLSSLGLEVADVQATAAGHRVDPLSVARTGSPSFKVDGGISLRTTVAWDGFRSWDGGALSPRGGFMLRGVRRGSESFDFSSFELRPAALTAREDVRPSDLELYDARGVALLTTDDAQWLDDTIEQGSMRYLNADLRILPELARRLGDERLAGIAIGTLDIDLNFRPQALPAVPALAPGIAAPPPCGDWSGIVDVALTNMSNIGQAGIATVNGRSVVVVLPSADLKNVGTANVPWYSKFTNLGVPPWNDQHPYLVWQMSRLKDGIFEPLGKGDLKHAFLTINSGCDAGACTDSHVLGLGCSDVYGTGTNNSVGSLGPRPEVTASTGIWAHCGGIASHFDTNGDCVQDFSGAGENSFTHGMKIAESDLQMAGARYFVEAFYIILNDTNIFNSMGFREVAPAKPTTTWSFPTVGAYVQGPPINVWVNPTTPGADADNRVLDLGAEGRVQLAVRVLDVVGSPGRKRFAYALQNHDFDRRIKSFKVPFDTNGAVIDNITFVDNDGIAANNWTSAVDATGITWTAPAGTNPPAELDYVSMLAFRFDIDRTGATAQANLGVFEAGSPTDLTIQTLGPMAPVGPPPGSFFTLTPCRLVDTRDANGPALNANQSRTFNVSSQCGVPSTAKAVALNVTAIDGSTAGHVTFYTGNTVPGTATLNYSAGQTRANNLVMGLDGDGTIKAFVSQAAGSLHLAIDVTGYFE